MQTAALITAAGMSSRMGDFKPMLNIGSISIAQRVVATFQQAGIDKIVIVTGYNAVTLERHLTNQGIVFLRNEDYEHTHMFDSVRIGIEYLKDKCDRFLFTPVDIPLFTCETVQKILESRADLTIPVCSGKDGHPIMISTQVADLLLADGGEGGLKGALSRCVSNVREIEVDDAGILHDADTPDDYKALLKFHNEQLVRPTVSLGLAKETVFFDARVAMLLGLIEETGSVRTACTRMQLSYSSGWNIIRKLESQLSSPLITRTQGGAGGGKSHLTEEGRQFLERYNAFEDELKDQAQLLFGKYFDGVFK